MSETRKSPFLAGLLSTMPGLGQVYVGYYINGFVYVLIVAAIIATLDGHHEGGLEPFLGIFLGFFWLFNIIDAVRKAQMYNLYKAGERPEKLPTDSPLVGGVVLLVAGVLFTMKIMLGVNLDWLSQVWPLALVIGGIYLVWKYFRTRRSLGDGGRESRRDSDDSDGPAAGARKDLREVSRE